MIASMLFSLLVFPGLVFLVSLAFFTQYLVRKISARYQRRMGPSYVGPAGVLQPLYDFLKLLRAKELVITRFSMYRVAEVTLLLGIAFIIASIMYLPLSPFRLYGVFDFLIFFYLSSVMPVFMLILAALSMPGPYTYIGVSRLLSMITLSEPAYFASLIIPIYLATRSKEPFMSISVAYSNVTSLWRDPIYTVILVLCLVSYIVSVQAKAMYPPFNIPEAEQEIIAGFETEFSGPVLALTILLHDLDVVIALIAGVYIILGGPAPFTHASIWGVVVLIVKYLLLLMVVVTIKNIMGRYRIEQALIQMFKYAVVPALVATVLALVAP